MKYILIFIIGVGLSVQMEAQTHPGQVTLRSGQVQEGEVAPIANKTWFEGVTFTDAAGRTTSYSPGEIKAFFVNEDYAFPAHYESITVEGVGTYFFKRQFSDAQLTYLFSPLPLAENEPPGAIEIYKVNNEIVKVEVDSNAVQWQAPRRDVMERGGVVTEQGDTLRGDYVLEKSKINLTSATTNARSSFDINKIRGFYNNQTSYYNVNVAAPGERAAKELCWVVIDGPVIQLVARAVDLTTYQQSYRTYYDNWGRLRQYPTATRVRSGSAVMFTIRHHAEDKALNFLPDPFQSPTRLGNVLQLRDWLKEYPALQAAALGNEITSLKALVHLYNLHRQITTVARQ